MKVVHLSHYKNKLMDITMQLYLENDGNMPKGFIDKTLKNLLILQDRNGNKPCAPVNNQK
jgi:hypothetical protein